MSLSFPRKVYKNFIHSFPILLLFFLALTGYDLSFFLLNFNFSFNFIYIAIFFWILKKPERLGYGLVFFAGIINDVVQNFPIGVSSINFLLLCSIALFIRSRTLVPNLLYDWVFFLIAILIISSVHYSILTTVFDMPIRYGTLMSSSLITFLVYPLFSKIFNQIYIIDLRQENAK
jgi:rod shape-determining protein MreD